MDKSSTIKTNLMGFAYLFNLIVGCGSLMLPMLFWLTGYGLGTIIMLVLSFFSFVSATFVFESLSICNALQNKKRDAILQGDIAPLMDRPSGSPKDKEEASFEIKQKFELVEMINIVGNKALLYIFLIIIVGYLYADLCIFYIVVGNSLENIICTSNYTQSIQVFCNEIGSNGSFSLFISLYVVIIGSMVFFDMKGTKPVQIITGIIRWSSLLLMITLSIIRSIQLRNQESYDVIPFNITNASYFIGAALYSFMCHHSIPSLVSIGGNVSNPSVKMNYSLVLGSSLFASLIVYLLLAWTAVFSFKGSEINVVYTLNFSAQNGDILSIIIAYYLALYPILALASSIPTIGITLRENIISFLSNFITKTVHESRAPRYFISKIKWLLKRIILPFLVVVPPLLVVTLISRNLKFITSITGNYFGAAIQYVIPCILVRWSRIKASEVFGNDYRFKSSSSSGYLSPFGHWLWLWLVFAWSIFCFVIITIQTVIMFK